MVKIRVLVLSPNSQSEISTVCRKGFGIEAGMDLVFMRLYLKARVCRVERKLKDHCWS